MREEAYPIDISGAQFEAIRPLLESVRKKIKPREVDGFEVGCALLTVLRGGGCPRIFRSGTRSIRTLCAGIPPESRESVCWSRH